jgi:hypothetical protein
MQYITSNGQYAIATSVDTIRISGKVEDQATTTFRMINPTEVGISGDVTVDSVYPPNATLYITWLNGIGSQGALIHPIAPTTTHTLRITASDDLEMGVILFQAGNIYHRLYVKRPP